MTFVAAVLDTSTPPPSIENTQAMAAASCTGTIGGSVNRRWSVWEQAFPGSSSSRCAKFGARYAFIEDAGTRRQHRLHRHGMDTNMRLTTEQQLLQYANEGILVPLSVDLIQKGKAARLPLLVHQPFCVAKPGKPDGPYKNCMATALRRNDTSAIAQLTKRVRTVVNFKPGLNQVLLAQPYKVGSARKAKRMLRSQDFMVTIDVESMYHNVACADHILPSVAVDISWSPALRRWAAAHNCKLAAFRANCFGVATAGFIATSMLSASLSVLPKAVRFTDLMDDIMAAAASFPDCLRAAAAIVATMAAFGWRVSVTKSELIPAQLRLFGGFHFDCLTNLCLVPSAKLAAYQAEWIIALKAWRARQRCRMTYLARIVGQILSMSLALYQARAFVDPLIEALSSMQRRQLPWSAKEVPSEDMISALDWWASVDVHNYNGMVIQAPPVSCRVVHDSSGSVGGWRASENFAPLDPPSAGLENPVTRFLPRHFRSRFSCHAETATGATCVIEEVTRRNLRNGHIQSFTDNFALMTAINKIGARSAKMNQILEQTQVWPLLRERNMVWSAKFLSGLDMQTPEILVDQASRPTTVDLHELELSAHAFNLISAEFGPFTCDLMATSANCKVQPFIGPPCVLGASAFDAFRLNWNDLPSNGCLGVPFCFPAPTARTVQLVLDKVKRDKVNMCVVLPWSPGCPLKAQALLMSRTKPLIFRSNYTTLQHPLGQTRTAARMGKLRGSKSISGANHFAALILSGQQS
jgi:hypothetical protein